MPATPITASTRFARFGVTKVVFASAVANKAAPTRAEINAGTDLSNEVSEISGFQVESAFIDAPDLGSAFTAKVAGRTNAGDSSIKMYESVNGVDVSALLPRGTTGFLLWLEGGDTAGRYMDVYPITIGSIPKDRSIEDVAQITVNVAITSTPIERVVIPA